MFIVHFKICCQRLAPEIKHSMWYQIVPRMMSVKTFIQTPQYGSCNISRVARCVTHSNKANTVLSVWKLHCAGWKIHSLTKSKISPVCVDRFSLFFHQLRTRSYAWDCYKIWFANLTDLWENQRFLHAQCSLGHAVCVWVLWQCAGKAGKS